MLTQNFFSLNENDFTHIIHFNYISDISTNQNHSNIDKNGLYIVQKNKDFINVIQLYIITCYML